MNMKKIWKALALVFALAMMMTACSQTPASTDAKGTAPASAAAGKTESDLAYIKDKGEMVIGITEYEPMNFKDEKEEWTGFDTEFAKLVAEKLGVTAKFIVIEWDGKIMELDSKAIDCVWNGMTLTDEVKNGMSCTDPYVVNSQVLVMPSDKIENYKKVEDLKDLKFVAESGSAGEKAIKDAGYECTAVTAQSDALLEVSSGAADACVIDITMAKAMTGEGSSYADLKPGLSLTSEEYGIGFRKGSDMTAEVNKIIKELKADGSLQKLADKYELTLAE